MEISLTPEPHLDAADSFADMLPTPEGLGIIKSLDELATILGKEEKDGQKVNTVLKFAAGLPDHKRPKQVQAELHKYADLEYAQYARYPTGTGINEDDVREDAAKYHTEVSGIATDKSRIALSEGSTPALNHLIRMMPLQKAKKRNEDGSFPALGQGCVLELFEQSYPLYKIPANQMNMTLENGGITQLIKLDTDVTVEDGKPLQSKPWKLNKASVIKSFEANRDKIATLVFSSNPSGSNFDKEETDFLAQELLKDFEYRTTHEPKIPAKLVIQDIAYFTMRAPGTEPYLLVHAFDKMIEEQSKILPRTEEVAAKLLMMKRCKETIITEHSLSKAEGVAGDRVAYAEGNPTLINALRETYTQDMLSYSNAGLHAAKGAYAAGMDHERQLETAEIMKEYFTRRDALEQGMNRAYSKLLADKGLELTQDQIEGTMPFPNSSSESFFTVMNLKPLLGQPVDPDFVARVQSYIDQIKDEGIRNSFGTIFKDGKINEDDLPLYFMFKTQELSSTHTAVCAVPLKNSGGLIRFSVGITPVDKVNQAVEAASEFFQKDPTYLRGIASYHKDTPATQIDTKFKVIERAPGTGEYVAKSA